MTIKNINFSNYDLIAYGEKNYINGLFEDSFLDCILDGFGMLEGSYKVSESSIVDICNLVGISEEYKTAILDELEGKDADSPIIVSIYENVLFVGFFTCICEEWGSNAVAFYAPCKVKEV